MSEPPPPSPFISGNGAPQIYGNSHLHNMISEHNMTRSVHREVILGCTDEKMLLTVHTFNSTNRVI